MIWLLLLIPFPILSVRFAGHSIYFYDDDGELASSYIEQYVMVYHVTAAITVIVTSSTICFILAIITILRYRIMYKEYGSLSASNKQDLLLFGQAFVSLILQMALVGYQIMRFIGGYYNLPSLQAFALIYFYYVNDAFSLVSPISKKGKFNKRSKLDLV
uniref:Serpentine receptor class gamma n=1 Tax=Panagrolaimus davidi TaxID=227884 RepID=A0A914P9U2_9BILA